VSARWRSEPLVAGVDEAGRGPLAGPVVAAAVILPPRRVLVGLADSKTLEPGERARLALRIRSRAVAIGLGWADSHEVDALDILQATLLAMRRALLALPVAPRRICVDGDRAPSLAGLPRPPGGASCCETIVRGDALDASIAAASILAKTWRDAWMAQAARRFPEYGFAEHKGYGTAPHLAALDAHGPCVLHRRTFEPVRSATARRATVSSDRGGT